MLKSRRGDSVDTARFPASPDDVVPSTATQSTPKQKPRDEDARHLECRPELIGPAIFPRRPQNAGISPHCRRRLDDQWPTIHEDGVLPARVVLGAHGRYPVAARAMYTLPAFTISCDLRSCSSSTKPTGQQYLLLRRAFLRVQARTRLARQVQRGQVR